MEARLGADGERRERFLNRALSFDDDVAEALYSRNRSVRTYSKSQATELRNNYNGATPSPAYIPAWRLSVSGLASGRVESLTIADLQSRFARHDQVTRLCCVEGWSAIASWGGLRFADFLRAFPPAPGARWARLDSSVNLDSVKISRNCGRCASHVSRACRISFVRSGVVGFASHGRLAN